MQALWRRRATLSAQEWHALFRALATLSRVHAVGRLDPRSDDWDAAFADFFVRHVAEATPSESDRPSWITQAWFWYLADSLTGADLTLSLGELERRDGVRRKPALAEIERTMYRPAEQLCFDAASKVMAGAPLDDVTDDELVRSRVESLLSAKDAGPVPQSAPAIEIPTAVVTYLERKATAAAHSFESPPRPGQIVAVESLRGPAGPIDEDLARPLCAVIDLPTEVDDVWWGWMVGSELDYACEWDFVLGTEDEPRDPIAATIQLWNPVRVYLPSVARVIGQLSPDRHAALHSMVADFLAEPGEAVEATAKIAVGASPYLASRTTSTGMPVTTGMPITAETDPRNLYQTLYEGAADVLQLPAIDAAHVAEQARWLAAASVQTLGVYRFLATAAHDPELTLELEFQLPGTGEPLVLMQKHGPNRLDAPILLGAHRIDFAGGIAVPGREAAAELVGMLKLPQAFADWATTSEAFARSRGATTAPMRAALASLMERAKAAALAPFDVMYFGFPHLVPSRTTRKLADPGSAAAVVTGLEPAPAGAKVVLFWLGHAPDVHEVVVAVSGEHAGQPLRATWLDAPTLLQVEGLDAAAAWITEARFHDGVLHLNLKLPQA
jgi:hypothetical protein